MRIFLATSLAAEPAFQAAADRFVAVLRRQGWQGRAVAAASRHLTYVFLGEVAEAAVHGLAARLDRERWPAAIAWRIDRAGTFGPAAAPRVVWLGSRAQPPALLRLQRRLAELSRTEGLLGDGEGELPGFVPHVSVWRVDRVPQPLRLPSWTPCRVMVGAVELVQSTLTPQGARYRTVARWLLSAEPPARADSETGGSA